MSLNSYMGISLQLSHAHTQWMEGMLDEQFGRGDAR